MKSRLWWFILTIIVLSLLQIWPLLVRSGFFVTHDGNVTVVRTYELDKVLKDGQFPPRWAPDLAYTYGYPIFNFFYPLPNFLSELFHLVGFNFTDSVKVVFSLSMIGSGLAMFLLGKKLWGDLGGLLSAVIYMFVPYRAVELYVRGSLPELLVLMWLPLIFLSLFNWLDTAKFRHGMLYSIFLSLLILSHNILSLISMVVVVIYGLILIYGKRKNKFLLFTSYFSLLTILALSLTAFFWLPALVEKKYTILDEAIRHEFNFREHFVYPLQLIYSPWGYGGSKYGPIDGMSFRIGKEFILLAILSSGTLWWWRERRKKWLVIFFVMMALSSLLMALNFSAPIWELIPVLFYIQYPWRFYSLLIFALAVMGGAVGYLLEIKFNQRRALTVAMIIIIYIVVNNLRFFQPSEFTFQKEAEIINREKIISQTTGYADENLPIWVKQKPNQEPAEKFEVLSGTAEINITEAKSHLYRAQIIAYQPSQIRFNQFYFPGWKIFVDGDEAIIDYDNAFGVMDFRIQEGVHEVVVKLADTPVRRLGNYTSFFSFLAIFIVVLLNFYHQKSKIKIWINKN